MCRWIVNLWFYFSEHWLIEWIKCFWSNKSSTHRRQFSHVHYKVFFSNWLINHILERWFCFHAPSWHVRALYWDVRIVKPWVLWTMVHQFHIKRIIQTIIIRWHLSSSKHFVLLLYPCYSVSKCIILGFYLLVISRVHLRHKLTDHILLLIHD